MAARVFKFDNNFKPTPRRDGDELYPNGIFEFNITQLQKFIADNSDMFQPELVSVELVRRHVSKRLNKQTIETADTSKPILLAEISPNRFNVIDGNHRLEKAYIDNLKMIAAYRILAEQHIDFLTSVRAYKAYIEYWNEKVTRKFAY